MASQEDWRWFPRLSPLFAGSPMVYVFYLLLVPVGLAVLNMALGRADQSQADSTWYGSPETARAKAKERRERVSV